jgi:hypothetical protein
MRRILAMALVATTMACGPMARAADETELDPAKVSDGLKAIFQFVQSRPSSSEREHGDLISGTIGSTYVRFGADQLRARWKQVTRTSNRRARFGPGVADILFPGVDLGIVRFHTLDYLERKECKDIKRFTHVMTYNEEMQMIAPKSIASIQISTASGSASTCRTAAPVTAHRVRAARHQAERGLHRAAHRDGEAAEGRSTP